MENRQFKDFCKALAGLGEMFNKPISDTLYELYWESLKDLSFPDFNRAANVLARTAKFFPRPVEFREQVLPDVSAQAALAYEKVERAFVQAGIYKSVVFDDPVTHAVIENLGGWVKYNRLTDEESKWWRKDFEKRYQELAPLVVQGKIVAPLMLPGLFAGEGTATEQAKTPVLIGDSTKILAWTKEVKALKEQNDGFKKVKKEMPKLSELCEGDGVTQH